MQLGQPQPKLSNLFRCQWKAVESWLPGANDYDVTAMLLVLDIHCVAKKHTTQHSTIISTAAVRFQ